MNWITYSTNVRWHHSKDKPNLLWVYSFDDEYYYRIKTVKAWVIYGWLKIPYSVRWGVTAEFKRAIARIKAREYNKITESDVITVNN